MKKLVILLALAATVATAGNSSRVVYFNTEGTFYHLDTNCNLLQDGKVYQAHENNVLNKTLCPRCNAHHTTL